MDEELEELEKLRIKQDSENILKKVKIEYPLLYDHEVAYQSYRTKFSEEYFKGSPFYMGPSCSEFIINNKNSIQNINIISKLYLIYLKNNHL